MKNINIIINKKNIIKTTIILSSIILVLFLVIGITQAYYSNTAYSPSVNEYSTGILSITATNKSQSISLTDALPISNEDALAEEPYIFAIKNVGNVDYKFNIKLLANNENTVDPQYIKVKIDDEEIKLLSNCTNSIIMEDVILKAGETMDIKLWVWLSKNDPATPNSEIGKTFTSQIVADGQAVYTSSNNHLRASQYITSLYNSAEKTEVVNNDITYHVASDVGLMNDRLASMSTGIEDGNIRYYGANPNNYVWFGETYTKDYTIKGSYYVYDYNSVEECLDGEGYEAGSEDASIFCSSDKVIPAGTKKLYRIIGVFNNRLKLITNDSIGNYSWDTSDSSVNNGYGINEWSQADLMKLLNQGYNIEEQEIGKGLYWARAAGQCYNGFNNSTIACDFGDIGIGNNSDNDPKNMIEEVVWNLGGYNSLSLYPDNMYTNERSNNVISNPSDGVPRTISWSGKVALMYPSDYGYATDFNVCNKILAEYYYSECRSNNWLWNKEYTWFLTSDYRLPYTGLMINSNGQFNYNFTLFACGVRPVFYLKSQVSIISGSGTESDPYVIG